MAVVADRSSVLHNDSCDMTPGPASEGCRSTVQTVHRNSAHGASGIRVRRATAPVSCARIRTASECVAAVDALSAVALRESDPCLTFDPPRARASLISAGRARTTPISCLRGRSGPKKRSRTKCCDGTGVAQRRISGRRFMFDSCCYRAQKVNILARAASCRTCDGKRISANRICNILNCQCFSGTGPPESGHVGTTPVLPESPGFTRDSTCGTSVRSVYGACFRP